MFKTPGRLLPFVLIITTIVGASCDLAPARASESIPLETRISVEGVEPFDRQQFPWRFYVLTHQAYQVRIRTTGTGSSTAGYISSVTVPPEATWAGDALRYQGSVESHTISGQVTFARPGEFSMTAQAMFSRPSDYRADHNVIFVAVNSQQEIPPKPAPTSPAASLGGGFFGGLDRGATGYARPGRDMAVPPSD